MTIGGSLFLIAIGAILYFAVEGSLGFIDIQTAGLILMIVGGLGLILGLFLMMQARRTPVVPEREVVRERERL
jgi:hypothetical protein